MSIKHHNKLSLTRSLIPGVIFAFFLVIENVGAQSKDSMALNFSASYTCDFGRNFTGGIKTGNFYLGMINLSLNKEFGENSEFFVQVQNTHGSIPSNDYVGDLQVFSNIENGDFTYLYMLWYKLSLNHFSIKVGVHDLNSEFLISDKCCWFINSSFGIQPSLSWNLPAPIFPKNALGMILKYEFSDKFSVQTALYDGDPGNLDEDRYNLDWSIDFKTQGILNVTEFELKTFPNESRINSYKLGFQYHSGNFVNLDDSSVHKGNYGIYFIADQTLTNRLSLFCQIGLCPSKFNVNPFYASFGVMLKGFGSKENEAFGLAWSYVPLSKEMSANGSDKRNFETAIELMYTIQLSENILLKPDLQYIINPGIKTGYSNALIGMLRTCFMF